MSESAGEFSSAHDSPHAASITRVLQICNKKGLHARASAKFVQTVEKFDAEVKVKRGHEVVGGTSIMGLMMLAAGPGTTITVEASGREAAEVVDALEALVSGRLTEEEWGCWHRAGSSHLFPQYPCRRSQIGDEILVLALFVRLVLDAQQERGVDGDEGGGAVGQM